MLHITMVLIDTIVMHNEPVVTLLLDTLCKFFVMEN